MSGVYFLYDNKKGPQLSEEQPDEGNIEYKGPLKVSTGGLIKDYEIFFEKGTKRTWAKLTSWRVGWVKTEKCVGRPT